ncbi:hypothetical protein B0H14DRAFT_3094898 [Mycena olivaceomarginata]|nr:hypothetical protein B0H14DRAFT_3094898 [Mycena olivaceomarginata]
MADSYLDWSLNMADEGLAALYTQPEHSVEETQRVYVVDLFWLIPVSPTFPTVVITVRALEVFRVASLRCPPPRHPGLGRSLCDIHGVAPRPYLAAQFTIAFDVYLAIRATRDKRVQAALGRDAPNWRLKNACPACLPPFPLPLLATFDGNNSAKRFLRREREVVDADGTTVPGTSKERRDNRVAPGDYYHPREEVDKWSREGMEDLMKAFVPGSELADEGDGCSERTGIFPALCRHGFVLVVVDMIQSGELEKYPFSITVHLLKVLGEVGIGYDIGCRFGKMVRMHPALSSLAASNNFKALVGAFHGHAHNRRCQLTHLSTYVKGMGLEDLEGCETFFSKSNALASTTRYATAFHRQQAISTYMKHADTADAYQGLSLLLANKYRRALKIKQTLPLLGETMVSMGVASRSVFETWLEKEKGYLASLSKEPAEETLQMEYYQKLVNLQDYESQTRCIETQRRHAMEVHSKTLAAVHDLEIRLGIATRWRPGDAEWVAAAKMLGKRRYQRALDELEGLVVARMFELSKVNMGDTGYKLRKHIAKALQACSKGVKSALERYNNAAAAMTPPRNQLTWDQIVDYAFLADFDLLREGREDIRSEPWAQPAGRVAMDQHFKLLRADEEIACLNLEIPRFVTYMADEKCFPLRMQRMERERFNDLHKDRLLKLSKEPGFTASILPGCQREQGTLCP